MDAVHFHVREDNRTIKKAVYVAIGTRLDGTREVLGMWIGGNESAKYWLGVLNEIRNRGVEDIMIVSVDGLTGFGDAINAVFPKAEIQRCIVHQIRYSTKFISYKDIKPFMKDLALVYNQWKKYSYSEEELKRHFEFAAVLAGMFKMATFLFGVEFREIVGDAMPQTWHEDVRFFEVLRGGSPIAHFYLDPYVRTGRKSGGAWMNSFANRCARRGEMPLALMALNLPVPDGEGKCFMPFREVETLFHEFGHALQAMLTKVDEEDAAGTSLVEWDAVEVASQFMENWCLDDRTGIPVPEDLKRRVRAAKNFRAATACRRQLAFAKTDMLLHLGAVDDPDAVKNEMFAHFGVPSVDGDLFLYSFSHIFGGGYAAGYYG